ncbi:GH92 family glycosyl hydrolase [Paenibacillus sp. CECT 9249]|uniref:GH92 family glycosyl hydrolase n=1 Tax=unclassified Paenibacillus TaxID=185978 RepID=UPI001C115709|nr:GH92 family glycosyl hydrolase [Paenibacillus sp. CECT 9249]MBU5440910.1 GH92 family glycosyl hydrolase [Paenibacillus sp. MSJ-34]
MKKQFRKWFHAIICFTVLAGTVNMPSAWQETAAAAEAGAADFFSSFEADGPPLNWVNTAETKDGEKLAKNIDGNASSLIGNITDTVVKVTSNSKDSPSSEQDVNLTDGNSGTKWLTFANKGWVQYELAEPAAVVAYTMTSANDSPDRDPVDWTVYGSTDGTNWKLLDAQTGQSFPDRYLTKTYEMANETKYSFYKLDITRNNGSSNIVQLADWLISDGVDRVFDMKSRITAGPAGLYTGKSGVGWTGLKALTLSGTITQSGEAYAYNKIYETDIPVTPNMELSYYIAPEFTDRQQTEYTSTYAAVDLAFDDGTYLHDYEVYDQHGVKLDAQAQGESKTLYNNQWNFKKAKIGAAAQGKTIERILVSYRHPDAKQGRTFRVTVDDIKLESNPVPKTYSHLSSYVDTRRGTNANGSFSRGNNFPAVAVPHGFNFWTPKTNAGSDWIYQYQERNNAANLPAIEAFALSHEPSPWMGDRQTFHVMPSASTETPPIDRKSRALAFTHDNEIAKPYYYGVTFENGVQAELTPTDHAAMFRFTFPGASSNLIFDNQENNGGITLDAENRTITGYTDKRSGLSTGATRMFFYAEFDKPVLRGGKLSGSGGGGTNVQAYYQFDASADRTVTMKISTSLISVEQAKKNLEMEIADTDTFESVKERAQEQWDRKLGIIEVEGATEDQLVTLYSNMYRLFMYPNSAFENVGNVDEPKYQHADQTPINPCTDSTATRTCAAIKEGKVYVNNGFWDTYRTAWPAYALLTPSMAGELIDGFLQQYRDGGWVSRWSSPGYANLMVGTSSDVAFADAYLKGVTNFDVREFYQSAVKNAAVVPPNGNVGRKGMDSSVFNGYTDTRTGEGMSWAMDGYINDYGIANLAAKLAEEADPDDPYQPYYEDDALYYMNRARNYVHMFNPHIGFFNGRNAAGEWRSSPDTFDPAAWESDYTETNAWNMAFHAPQDGVGLANLYGGKEGLAAKLDEFFDTPESGYTSRIHEMREARDVRMGMYAHSNQPAHHIIYMYNYVGQPWKTQELVREVLDRLYIGSEIGQGYAGDEDNGEMSAWYIFSAMGFYPLKMGSPEYAIGAPLFTKATIHLENGKDIVINAPNNSKENKYVQSLKLNGTEYTKNYIMHADLADGAVLDFDMGPSPNRDWGSGEADVPISITQGTDIPRPLIDKTDRLIAQGLGRAVDSEGTAAAELNKLFDNTSGSAATINGSAPWIQFQFMSGKEKINMYTLTSGGGSAAADPKSWILKGSNDGLEWTTLDTRTDETFQWRKYTRAFAIDGDAEYAYYRLEIAANNGGTTTSLAEMELLGQDIKDQDAVAAAVAALDLGDVSHVTTGIALPKFGAHGTTISWISSDDLVLSAKGKVISRPDVGRPDAIITLTATVSKGTVSQNKTFDVVVKAWSREDPPHVVDFATSFESGQKQPKWNNSRIDSKNVVEYCCGIGGMESKVGSVDYDQAQGETNSALLYSGNAADAALNYSYNQVFEEALEIKPSTFLTYRVHPEGPNAATQPENKRETSQYVAMDLLFTDGTYLHDLGAVDQKGIGLNPLDQGKALQLDVWNTVTSKIGDVAAGKTVDKIVISYNATGHTGKFRGYVDDIQIYHLEDIPPLGDDARLQELRIDGEPLPGFEPGTHQYEVELPEGTTVVPSVTAVTYDPNAAVRIVDATVLPGTTYIDVTAEDGETTTTYSIYFKLADREVPKGNDATLTSIELDGRPLADFERYRMKYEVELPAGTSKAPTVTATVYDPNAHMLILPAEALPGTATIRVTSEDRAAVNTYEIHFTVKEEEPKGTDATLAAIELDGRPLAGFARDRMEYFVELPAGTSKSPTVAARATDGKANVEITQAGSARGKAVIVVTAEDGITKRTYTIQFSVRVPNPEPNPGPSTSPSPQPSPKPAPKPNPEPEPGIYKVKPEDFKPAAGGKVVLEVPAESKAVQIPLDAVSKLGNNVLEVKAGGLMLQIPSEVISQAAALLSQEQQTNGTITLRMTRLTEGEVKARIGGQHVKAAGGAYILELVATAADGTSVRLDTFNKPVTIGLQVNATANPKLVGIYGGANSGPLAYIGGEYASGEIAAQISQSGAYAALEMKKAFIDVPATHWAASVIEELAAKGIVNGVSATHFEPGRSVTRAEFAALLVKAFGFKEEAELSFEDVHAGDWYAEAVAIAVKAGFVRGRSAAQFDPNAPITREEMTAMMIQAYEAARGKTEANGNAAFTDEASISAWALPYINAAAALQLVQGRGAGIFDPQGMTTRAEAAQAIYNVLNR